MACTEWTTILVYSQTCEPINFSQSSQPINSRSNTLVSSLACQLVNVEQCQLFSNKFNIKSALFLHNCEPCCKKSILAKVCFDAK